MKQTKKQTKKKKKPSNLKPRKAIDKPLKAPLPLPPPPKTPEAKAKHLLSDTYAGPVIRIRRAANNSTELKYTVLNRTSGKKKGDRGFSASSRRLSCPLSQPAPTLTSETSSDDEKPKNAGSSSSSEWKCFICDHQSNHRAMGTLYGPYFLDLSNYSLYLPDSTNSLSHLKEVWLHEDCVVWAPNVLLLGGHLMAFDAFMSELNFVNCVHCRKPRASLGCRTRGCHYSALHFPCAQELGCQLDESTFTVYCREHKAQPSPPKNNKCRRPDGKTPTKCGK